DAKPYQRAILPNGTIEDRGDRYFLEQALLRKRERNKLAARRKRDRKKQRMEALEQREKDLRKQYLALSMELMVCRSANQIKDLERQSLAASGLGENIQAGATQSLDALSSIALGAADNAGKTILDFTAINAEIADLHNSVDVACTQAEEAIIEVAHIQHEVSRLLSLLGDNI
ncbi:hypothetical protein FB639_002229, partial [Coemansia asiatica]